MSGSLVVLVYLVVGVHTDDVPVLAESQFTSLIRGCSECGQEGGFYAQFRDMIFYYPHQGNPVPICYQDAMQAGDPEI